MHTNRKSDDNKNKYHCSTVKNTNSTSRTIVTVDSDTNTIDNTSTTKQIRDKGINITSRSKSNQEENNKDKEVNTANIITTKLEKVKTPLPTLTTTNIDHVLIIQLLIYTLDD